MPRNHPRLTEGHIPTQMIRMAVPMIGGFLSMMVFNLTDTFFISRLGTSQLAAMSFTFPVVMLVASIALGLGMGAGSVISRAIGQGDHHKVQRYTTDAIFLSVLVVSLFSIAGLLTIGPVFRAMGADEQEFVFIRQYMTVWYSCVAFLIIPMVSNNAIRATGDTLTPSLIMMSAALMNLILDPIMIFGLFGFPRLEILGAAIATVLSRFLSLIGAIIVLHYRYQLIAWSMPRLSLLWRSWRQILLIAVPAILTNILIPLSNGLITSMVAGFGPAAVAALGVGIRIEGFAVLVPMALGSTMIPLVGQNWGAAKYGRIRSIRRLSNGFGLFWGILSILCLLPLAPSIAGAFSTDPEVVRYTILYLSIVPIGHGMMHISAYTALSFNAVGKPFISTTLGLTRAFILVVPSAWIGSRLFAMPGLFFGMATGLILSGSVAIISEKAVLGAKYAAGDQDPADHIGEKEIPLAVESQPL